VNSIELALQGAGRVLFAGLVFGAGLPVVYALAMRALTINSTTVAEADGAIHYRPSVLGRVLSVLLLAVIVGGVVLGLVMIVASGFGKTVSFEHLIPTIVDEK
jgi:formate/nitrite transporter FocA (FNT family)